jgi:hypothetical protein
MRHRKHRIDHPLGSPQPFPIAPARGCVAKQMYPDDSTGAKSLPLALDLKLLKSPKHPNGLSEHD